MSLAPHVRTMYALGTQGKRPNELRIGLRKPKATTSTYALRTIAIETPHSYVKSSKKKKKKETIGKYQKLYIIVFFFFFKKERQKDASDAVEA